MYKKKLYIYIRVERKKKLFFSLTIKVNFELKIVFLKKLLIMWRVLFLANLKTFFVVIIGFKKQSLKRQHAFLKR